MAARLALLGCMLAAALAAHLAIIYGPQGGVAELRCGLVQVWRHTFVLQRVQYANVLCCMQQACSCSSLCTRIIYEPLECSRHEDLTCTCAAQTLTGLPGLNDKTLQTAVLRMSKATVLGGAIVALQLAGSAFGTHIIEVRVLSRHMTAHDYAGLDDALLCRCFSTPSATVPHLHIRVIPEAGMCSTNDRCKHRWSGSSLAHSRLRRPGAASARSRPTSCCSRAPGRRCRRQPRRCSCHSSGTSR